MNIYTSIAPKHIIEGRQKQAISTWHGNIYSLNIKDEIDVLKDEYPNVNFIEAKRSGLPYYGKPYIFVYDILKEIEKRGENAVILNSDIDILNIDKFTYIYDNMLSDGMAYLHRWNYDQTNKRRIYKEGIDCLFVNHKYIRLIPENFLALGCTHWDIWHPYKFILEGCKMYSDIDNQIIGHAMHTVQYNIEQVMHAGKQFLFMMGKEYMSLNATTQMAYKFINKNTIYYGNKKERD